MRILVLNDSPYEAVRAALPWMGNGNTVTCVSSFEGFLEALVRGPWDVVSLDDMLAEDDLVIRRSGRSFQATGLDAFLRIADEMARPRPRIVVHSKGFLVLDIIRGYAGRMGMEVEHAPIP